MSIDLELNEEQQRLQSAANDLFGRRSPSEVVRDLEDSDTGYSPDLWREMAGLGWLGITFPDALGGHGGSFLDLLPIYEEMGRFLVPSPHLETVVIAGDVIGAVGSDEQRRTVLPAIADGTCIVSLAVLEPGGGFGPGGVSLAAVRSGTDHVLSGTKLLVPFAAQADRFVVAARTGRGLDADGITLFLVDATTAGISCDRLANTAGGALYAVSFEDVVVPARATLGPLGGGWAPLSAAMTKGAVLQTATIVGAARAVLEMTNQYAKDREQFGNPIGRYQAVQYMVSDVLIDLHRADLLARQAAFRIDTGRPYEREAAIAIAFGKRACAHLHRQAHEVHAGIGFMLEHDLTLYSRRGKYWENNLGDARYWDDQVAEAILA